MIRKKLRGNCGGPYKVHTCCGSSDLGASVGVDERGGTEGYFRPMGDSF